MASDVSGNENHSLVFIRNDNVWITGIVNLKEKKLTYSKNNRNPAISPIDNSIAFTSGHDSLTGFGRLFTMTSQC